jgi:hypothetical protein
MDKLKKLDPRAIPSALAKAERYRFLNEPREAESICRDILATDPEGQGGSGGAYAVLILAMTDLFAGAPGAGGGSLPDRVLPLVTELDSPYDRAYLSGVICERWAKAELARGIQHTPPHVVYDWLARAMAHFEEAEELAPVGNEDAVLRWNSCVRILDRNREIRPRPEESGTMADYQDV